MTPFNVLPFFGIREMRPPLILYFLSSQRRRFRIDDKKCSIRLQFDDVLAANITTGDVLAAAVQAQNESDTQYDDWSGFHNHSSGGLFLLFRQRVGPTN